MSLSVSVKVTTKVKNGGNQSVGINGQDLSSWICSFFSVALCLEAKAAGRVCTLLPLLTSPQSVRPSCLTTEEELILMHAGANTLRQDHTPALKSQFIPLNKHQVKSIFSAPPRLCISRFKTAKNWTGIFRKVQLHGSSTYLQNKGKELN